MRAASAGTKRSEYLNKSGALTGMGVESDSNLFLPGLAFGSLTGEELTPGLCGIQPYRGA